MAWCTLMLQFLLACLLLSPVEVDAASLLGQTRASRRRRRSSTNGDAITAKHRPRSNLNLLSEGKQIHRSVQHGEPFLDNDFTRDASNPLDAFLDSHPAGGNATAAAPAPAAAANETAGNATAKKAAAVQVAAPVALPQALKPPATKPAFYPSHSLASAGSPPIADMKVSQLPVQSRKPKGGPVSLMQYLNKPVPVRLAQMQAEKVDTTDMTPGQLRVPGVSPMAGMPIFMFSPSVDRMISASIAIHHEWEADRVQQICEMFQSKSEANFVDVGANLGTFTLPMAACLNGKGSVIAVEGMPTTAKHLKASIVANSLSNVALYNYAVSNEVPTNSITMDFNIYNPGGSSVENDNKVNYGTEAEGIYASGKRTESIGLTTLDSMYQSNPDLKKVLVMKMDIEGNEGRALKGAMKFLQEHPPCYLMVELDPQWLANAGTPIDDVKALLEKSGYAIPPSLGLKSIDTVMIEQKDVQGCLARFESNGDKKNEKKDK